MANDLSAFNSQVWSRLLIRNLDKVNVMLPLVNMDYEGEIKNLGDTVQVRTLGSVTVGSYTKGSTISYQDLTPTKEAMTIADAQYFAFKVDDVDLAQNDIKAIDAYTKRAAVAMNDEIEEKLLSNYAAAHASNRITGASSAALTLTSSNLYGYVVDARTALSKQNVPTQDRWLVIDPDTTSLFLKDTTNFIRATDLSDAVIRQGNLSGVVEQPGFVGRIAGFNVFESNNVPSASGAKYLQYGDAMAIAYAAQIKEVEAMRLQTTFANAVRGLLLHDTKVFAEASKRLGYIKAAA